MMEKVKIRRGSHGYTRIELEGTKEQIEATLEEFHNEGIEYIEINTHDA